jgi:hypothetical protein
VRFVTPLQAGGALSTDEGLIIQWRPHAAAGTPQRAADDVLRSVRARGAGHWESVARFVVAVFRADTMRAGASASVQWLVDELSRQSFEFAAMWRDHDVRQFGEGSKHLIHPHAGPIALEYPAFAVDGRPDLAMVVYSPATPADVARVRALIRAREAS